MDSSRSSDARAARIASRHHGLITLEQARSAGLSVDQVRGRVSCGLWQRIGRGVYRVAGAPATGAQDALAAVLRAGPTAAVSHLSALALFGVGARPLVPHITVAVSASARTRNAIVHRSPLVALDRTIVGCIPCTTPARSLVDAAMVVDRGRLAELVDEVICAGLCQPSAVIGAARRSQIAPGRMGVPLVRDLMRPWLDGITPGSPAEVRLLRRLADWRLPRPVSQHLVHEPDGTVVAALDLAWPDRRVGLEYDGSVAHAPRHLPKDVIREERLRALGWSIERVDRFDLRPSSTRLRDVLRQLLYSAAAA